MKIKINQSNIKLAMLSTLLIGSAGFSVNGYAATTSDNMAVTTQVVAACSIDAGAMTFGNYDPTAEAHLHATATIASTCTSGAAATISMDQGTAAGTGSTAAAPVRRMAGADGSFLNYAVYSNVGHSTVWGGTDATDVAVTGTGSAVSSTAYGRVPSGQAAAVTSFADSVVVTLTY
ncbi:spore coat protein U domain-containing protein, partial [Gammaproteobacteria bacterium]|nr:spore coat protein U domain-containing protein [Gammaproteobacteria bacterium]MDB3856530.1 spore coat protein U domain-containing protein [Gammaproteobacteria bacterium]MDC1164011.1 spore coat U domain-containing protein [Gammaproteobacteria bacterium]